MNGSPTKSLITNADEQNLRHTTKKYGFILSETEDLQIEKEARGPEHEISILAVVRGLFFVLQRSMRRNGRENLHGETGGRHE